MANGKSQKGAKPKNPPPKPTKRGGKRGSPKRPNTKKSGGVEVPQFLFAQLDPFNARSAQAKIPDNQLAQSATNRALQLTVGTTDATNGVAVGLYYCDPASFLRGPATVASSSSWTWSADWSVGSSLSNYGAIQSNFCMTRCVGYGLKIQAYTSPTATVGRLHVCLVPIDYSASSWNTAIPLNFTQMAQQPGYLNVPLNSLITDKALTVVGKPYDDEAFAYRSTAFAWNIAGTQITSGVISNTGWSAILIATEGCPTNTTVYDVEFVAHYESLIRPQIGTSVLDPSPAMPYQPNIMAAANNVVNNVPPVRQVALDAGEGDFWNDIEKVWKTGVQVASGVGDAMAWVEGLAGLFL